MFAAVQRAHERLYERLAQRYVIAWIAGEYAAAVGLCLVAVELFGDYVRFRGADFWTTLAIAEVALLAGFVNGTRRILAVAGPIRRWLAQGRGEHGAAAAWRAAIELPRRAVVIQLWRSVVLTALPVTVAVSIEFHFSASSVALLWLLLLTAASYPVLFSFLAAEMWMRPVVRETAALLACAGRDPEATSVPLRTKLLVAVPVINIASAVLVSARISFSGGGTLELLARDALIATAIGLTATMLPAWLVARSILVPARDLITATRRLRKGERATRVAVNSADELGMLALDFNHMLDALEERDELRDRTRELETRATRARMESRQRAERAIVEERGRIARELHDVVSHGVTAIVVQAEAADSLLASRPDQVAARLDAVEEMARQTLVEMDRFLGVLRTEDRGEGTRPTLEHLEDLAAPLRAGGVEVSIGWEGSALDLPEEHEQTVYRIVQEALTNVLKHARARRVAIKVEVSDRAVGLEIVDDGRTPSVAVGAEGHGLTGMRERASLLGGTLVASRRADGAGFTVSASLPLAAKVAAR